VRACLVQHNDRSLRSSVVFGKQRNKSCDRVDNSKNYEARTDCANEGNAHAWRKTRQGLCQVDDR
jgi:hypothetical protein